MESDKIVASIQCLERRIRDLETALAVIKEKQTNHERHMAEFITSSTQLIEKQSTIVQQLQRFMYIATGIILALQALGLFK